MSAPAQITILIPDPDEMMFVTGPSEQNIERIEREFAVKIVSRGAELRISGAPAQVARVGELVGAMRSISERDETLRKPALDRLIDDAKDAPVGAPEQLREVVATTVRGKRIASQSPNQRAYINAIRNNDLVFGIGPAGTGKCIAADSLVLTDRGMLRISELGVGLNAGETDHTYVVVHGIGGAERAELVYAGGESETRRITTRFGYSIEVTPEHPLLVMTAENGLQWRVASELRAGDVLALQRGQRMFGSRMTTDFVFARSGPMDRSRPIFAAHLDEQLAYFMGIITGDGNLTVPDRLGLSSREHEVVRSFEAMAARFGVHVFLSWTPDKTSADHVIASSQLYRLLMELGMTSAKAPSKRVPHSILEGPEENARAFLRGLFDTDGSVERNSIVSLTLTSEALIAEVQIILLNLGIVSSKAVKHGRYRGEVHTSHRLMMAGVEAERYMDLVGFSVARKRRPLRQGVKRNTNIDLIPFVGPQLIRAMASTQLSHAEHGLYQDYRHERRRPSYPKLTELVGVLERRGASAELLVPLREILARQLLFLEVSAITPSRAHVFDLTVPGSHSFVANGFINHNTFLGAAMGVAALRDRKVARLILTRPAVEAGERLGFLPGDLTEKIDPYLRPLYDALYEFMPAERFARARERNEIEVAPLAFLRGRTLNEAFIILDEAQNTTAAQMKMFLTRLGYGSQAVVNGDITQIDLERGQQSGLVVAREILRGVEGIGWVDFDEKDVVRHELVARIVRAYDRHEKEQR
jgi:phosphate starvation-inducible protein PhoH/intein/homing endonuclease